MNSIRAVLYDFDGTLADSTELIMRCYRHTMTTHLEACPPDEEWLSGFGTPLTDQIARFARTPEEASAMLDTYRTHQDELFEAELRPFAGAEEVLAELSRRGIALAIVTSRLRRATLRGLDVCGLSRHFEVIITPEDVTNAKPHPDPVLLALERLGVPPSAALFVGDSPHDIAAGRAAGTRTAGVLWGPFPRAALEEAGPDFLLERQDEVLGLL
ncbi:MAG TPA: HAD-IA family hydrolase [Longimicrobium sp.]